MEATQRLSWRPIPTTDHLLVLRASPPAVAVGSYLLPGRLGGAWRRPGQRDGRGAYQHRPRG